MNKSPKKSQKNSKTTLSLSDYVKTLADIKKRISEAQIKAAFAVNKELLKLYWYIGETIVKKQKENKWGSKIIEQLAKDLQNSFPGLSGFSRPNIFRMKAFFQAYEIVSEPPRQFETLAIFNIPWWHNVILLTKLKDYNQRIWYAQKTIENGWSSTVLELKIESNLYSRDGKAITNFTKTLPSPQSDLAQQSLKDPYVFDFLTFHKEHLEKDIEQGLMDNIQKFLLELGKGFAFVGRQYHIEIEEEDFYIDLLFYHIKLKCYVVVELKAQKFEPKDVGQLNFYLSAVDNILKEPEDKPTIGLLLCKTKKNIIAEYALQEINRPIGIAGYETAKFVESLPKKLKNNLPSIGEIEKELEKYELIDEIQKELNKPKKVNVKKTKLSKSSRKINSKN